MIYTTQGLMTPADMADLADLYDLNIGEQEARAEEEALEEAHAAHADECRICQEEDSQRETGARAALQMDEARRALGQGIQDALRFGQALPAPIRKALEEALAKAEAAIRAI